MDREETLTSADPALYNAWSGRGPLSSGLISDPYGPDSRVGYAGYVFNPQALIHEGVDDGYNSTSTTGIDRRPKSGVRGVPMVCGQQKRDLRCHASPCQTRSRGRGVV